MKNSPFMQARFSEAAQLLNSALDPKRKQSDKRRAARMEIQIDVRVTAFADGKMGPWRVAGMRNLSPRGLGLVIDTDWPADTMFILELPRPPNQRPRAPILCRVAHQQANGNGTFSLGAEFIGPMLRSAGVDSSAESERIRRAILK